jgi:hypothetical protein
MKNPYTDDNNIKLPMAQKREVLKTYSLRARKLIEMSGADLKINDGLIVIYSDMVGSNQWRTYKDWLANGYRVMPGQAAWCIWSKPKKIKEGTDDEFEMFAVAHVFNSNQVERIN